MIDIPVTLFLGVLVFAVALGALIAAWAAQPVADENRQKPKRKNGERNGGMTDKPDPGSAFNFQDVTAFNRGGQDMLPKPPSREEIVAATHRRVDAEAAAAARAQDNPKAHYIPDWPSRDKLNEAYQRGFDDGYEQFLDDEWMDEMDDNEQRHK
jgi:hypothetical protein